MNIDPAWQVSMMNISSLYLHQGREGGEGGEVREEGGEGGEGR